MRQRDSLLNRGQTPPDFAARGIRYEADCMDFKGATGITQISGQQAFGLTKLPGDEPVVRWANIMLGHA